MQSYQREAIKALKRGVILGTNTPLHILSDRERKLREKWLGISRSARP